MSTSKSKLPQISVFMPKEDFYKYKAYMDGLIFWKEHTDGTFEVKQIAPDKNLSGLLGIYNKK